MNPNEQTLPQARTKGLVTRELPGEVLVYDLKNHKAHCLNVTAALIWKHCDGKNSVQDIVNLMEKDLSAPVNDFTVWLAINQLGKAQLLESEVRSPSGISGISRRRALQQIGLGALLIPAVMTVVAPLPTRAATCVPAGEPYDPTHDCCHPTATTGCRQQIGTGMSAYYICSAKTQSSYPCNGDSDCCSGKCGTDNRCD